MKKTRVFSVRSAVQIKCIPSIMREWIMAHSTQCEVITPKYFRDEIQRAVMEAYKMYWG